MLAGIFLVTTLPAATILPWSIVTPSITETPVANHTSSSKTILLTWSSVSGKPWAKAVYFFYTCKLTSIMECKMHPLNTLPYPSIRASFLPYFTKIKTFPTPILMPVFATKQLQHWQLTCSKRLEYLFKESWKRIETLFFNSVTEFIIRA